MKKLLTVGFITILSTSTLLGYNNSIKTNSEYNGKTYIKNSSYPINKIKVTTSISF